MALQSRAYPGHQLQQPTETHYTQHYHQVVTSTAPDNEGVCVSFFVFTLAASHQLRHPMATGKQLFHKSWNEDRRMRAWWRQSGGKKAAKGRQRGMWVVVSGEERCSTLGGCVGVCCQWGAEGRRCLWPSLETVTPSNSCSTTGLDKILEPPDVKDSCALKTSFSSSSKWMLRALRGITLRGLTHTHTHTKGAADFYGDTKNTWHAKYEVLLPCVSFMKSILFLPSVTCFISPSLTGGFGHVAGWCSL